MVTHYPNKIKSTHSLDLSAEEYNNIMRGEWFDFVDFKEARKQHGKNVANCQKAVEEYNEKDRPLRILAVHGSGRSGKATCAYEESNSKFFLNSCLDIVEEVDPSIEIDEVSLRDYYIEPCNNCVSTSSAHCGWPCTCFPLDNMSTIFYPKILRSDILLCSTGVNQSTMSTRLKAFCDRMISLDGGFFVSEEQFAPKDGEWKARTLALASTTDIAYDQRLYGRVAAYFISTKDENNPHPTINRLHHTKRAGEPKYDPKFSEATAWVLKDGMEAYGYFHPVKYYAVSATDPDIDYMYDKEYMNKHPEIFEEGQEVIRQAIDLAKELKVNLPEFKPDRYNRT